MIKFDFNDILKWSEITGDTNPVHYIKTTGGYILPGMLVICHLFTRLLNAKITGEDALSVNIRFHKQTFTDRNYLLNNKDETYVLEDLDSQCFISMKRTVTQRKKDLNLGSQLELINFNNKEREAYKLRCSNRLPWLSNKNIYIISLSFFALLNSRTFLRQKGKKYTSAEDYFNSSNTLVLGQTYTFTKEFIMETFRPTDISVLIKDDILIPVAANKYIRQITCDVVHGNEVILSYSTTLQISEDIKDIRNDSERRNI
ncbi:hypothetical protein [Enterobacter cloacae]|uniref:hypothetical protein n=1 Tax=Enterobacter cloacae TaxID=550 RepID=UPI0013EFAB62|nr:hypothetical protein [Enterobacter cloacae]